MKRIETRSRRRGGMVLVAALVVFGGLVAVPGVASAKAAVNAHGFVECVGQPGKAKVSPPFASVPAATPRVWTVKLKMSCESTPTGAVTSAKLTATFGNPGGETCAALGSFQPSGLATFQIKWKGASKVNPTTIHYSSHERHIYGAPGPLNGHATWSFPIVGEEPSFPDGSASITGSYAGEFSMASIFSSLKMNDLIATCNVKKGLKKVGINGPSTIIDIDTSPLF